MRRFEHLAIIAHDMGVIFEYLGVITLVPFVVLIIYREWDLIIPMGMVPLIFVVLGVIISRVPRKEYVPQLSVALVAVALTWMAVALIGAVPFVLGLEMAYIDGVFEAMSGWTDTGITMMTSIDTAPKTLIFWRSFMQWVGGNRGDLVRDRHAEQVKPGPVPSLQVRRPVRGPDAERRIHRQEDVGHISHTDRRVHPPGAALGYPDLRRGKPDDGRGSDRGFHSPRCRDVVL